MHRVHEAFPLIVYQGMIGCHEKFKENNLDFLRDYWFDGYQNESPEYSGRIFVHHQKQCHSFFEELRDHINNYFEYLKVDYEKLDYHIIKSWVGLHKDDDTPSVKPHNHNESNISFVYYLKTDETSDKFCIVQEKNRNECVGDLFMEAIEKNLITEYNRYNCNVYSISPIEGSLLLFPSCTGHFTQKFTERNNERVVIAGDVRVTLKKENSNYHQGSTHPSQWLSI